jgi:hypothetical protein
MLCIHALERGGSLGRRRAGALIWINGWSGDQMHATMIGPNTVNSTLLAA